MPRRTMASGCQPEISTSSSLTLPFFGLSTPAMVSISVVLPAPFGPSRQVIEPALTSSETPLRASILP